MNRKVARGEILIPEGWQKVALGEFMEFKNGINADKSAYGQGIKFVNIMDVFRKSFLKKDVTTHPHLSFLHFSSFVLPALPSSFTEIFYLTGRLRPEKKSHTRLSIQIKKQ